MRGERWCAKQKVRPSHGVGTILVHPKMRHGELSNIKWPNVIEAHVLGIGTYNRATLWRNTGRKHMF